ncbi:hypothetical protein N869_06335, partial [Cellulomonas bogoriensis 69B4 = DSM 16987]
AVRWMLARVHPGDVLRWWSDLVEPALVDLGARAAVTGPGETPAPSLTAAAFAELRSRAAVSSSRLDDARTPAVLALGTGRGDGLVLHVLAAALQENGVLARLLSPADPAAVGQAVEDVAPAAVVAHLPDQDPEGLSDTVDAVVRVAPDLPVFLHLEGAAAADLRHPSTHRVRTLTGALHEVLAVVP